jgi:hypothetical protein
MAGRPMEKIMKQFVYLLTALVALVASSVFALTPSRTTASTTLGAVSVTNDQDYTVKKLVSIQVSGVLPVISTGLVSFVQDNITNNVGTIITAAGGAQWSSTSTVYVFKSGVLSTTLGTNTGASLRFLFENYP